MNENARTWVAALRSGMYRQGRSRLRAPGGKFCCLGVACDIYQRATGDGEWGDIEGAYVFRADGETKDNVLPVVVTDWLGLSNQGGRYANGKDDALWAHNDAGDPFSDIAAIIESEPEGLFA